MIGKLTISILASFLIVLGYVGWMHYLIEQSDSLVWIVALCPPLVCAVAIIIFKELKI